MQNTHQKVSAEFVINKTWQFMNNVRGRMSVSDMFTPVLMVLYAFHKGYNIRIIDNHRFEIDETDDSLLCDIVNQVPSDKNLHRAIILFIQELGVIEIEDFNAVYVEVLKRLFDLVCSNAGRASGEFYTPSEVSKLMAYYVKKESCNSIFDPFCGTASIINEFSDREIHFEGQEINQRTALYSRINLESIKGVDNGITVCDSFGHWNKGHFDAVVSCPPFGMRLSQDQLNDAISLYPNYSFSSVEDIMQIRSFHINDAKMTIMLLATGFCFRGGHDYKLRQYLVEHNFVDTIIALPQNILYGTGIASIILICKKNRISDEPIKFIHAEDYFVGDRRKRTFDYNRFIEMIQGDLCDCAKVSLDEVRQYDYNLNPALYYNKNLNLKEGQRYVRIGDLLTPVEGDRLSANDAKEMMNISTLSNDFIEILLNNSKQTSLSSVRRNTSCRILKESSNKYLLAFTGVSESRYGINTDGKDFVFPSEIKVYKVDGSLVIPEYLAYLLINNNAISKGCMPLSSYMMFPIVIDSLEQQNELVSKMVQQYEQKVSTERDADAKRLGVKQNISDLEHMLGATQLRIGKIISRLENATPASENYQHIVKSMKDNIEYMNRLIHYNNARIDVETLNKKEGDIAEFIMNYADSWNNYGGGYFELNIVNELKESTLMSFDKTLLTVMFDSILNNVVRHGFHKRKNYTNKNIVQIRLSAVDYLDASFVLFSIANNGDPIADGFTIEDYISRGRYTSTTGRSGLGGHHVYQIVKGHNGFLCLDNNKMWNMVVDVLLPIDSTELNSNSTYEKECI